MVSQDRAELRRMIGMRIREWRNYRSLHMEQLGEQVGLKNPKHTISLIERGEKSPSAEELQKIADVLGVELVELMETNPVRLVISNRIKKRREALGLTQAELGTRVGQKHNRIRFIDEIESGQRPILADMLPKFATALDMPLRDLVRDLPQPPQDTSPLELAG